MSKRRADDDYEASDAMDALEAPHLTNSNSSSRRSIRSCCSTAPTTLHSNDYTPYMNHPAFKAWSSLFIINDKFNGTARPMEDIHNVALNEMFKSQSNQSLFQTMNSHKYNNHIIEVPFVNNENFQLKHNPNFPFSRDPYSISVQCIDFVQNLNSYTHFRKIILKNAKILLHLETLNISKPTTESQYFEFTIECDIYSCIDPEFKVKSCVTDKLLTTANIVLEHSEVWVNAYYLVQNCSNDVNKMKSELCYYWKNLTECLLMMDEIDLAVVVRGSNTDGFNVQISDILHAYYT